MERYNELYAKNNFQNHLKNIFINMALAMGITAATAYAVYRSILHGGIFYKLMLNPLITILLTIAELGVTVVWRANLFNTEKRTCETLFYVYAFINGLTFGILPLIYSVGTLFTAFLYTMIFFICCAVIGYTTKMDLTRFGSILFAGLISILIGSLLSLIIPALRNSLALSYAGVLLFMVYTAYDIQKIKKNYASIENSDIRLQENFAVYGAFELYLDFVNLFLDLLRIIDKGKRD